MRAKTLVGFLCVAVAAIVAVVTVVAVAAVVRPSPAQLPLTQISSASNKVLRQYTGPGGDSVRYAHNSLWLTHLHAGLLWRLPPHH